jgi:hypothetical protein
VKLTKLNKPGQFVNVQIADYLIDWDRKVSGPQMKVKKFLYPYWKSHVVTEELVIPGSRLRCDLLNWTRRIAIEVSPKGSHSWNPFFHKTRVGFGSAMGRDLDKAKWLEENGLKLVEVLDDDLDTLSVSWFQSKYGITL